RLKKHLLIHRINIQKARSKKKNNGDDIPIIDNAYNLKDEEAAETVFEKLIKNACNIDKDSYNSIRFISESETEIIEKSSQWKQKLQETEERIQHLIDTNEISKTDKIKYIFAIHYIKLLQNNTPKLETSRIVAHIHNGSEYRARCIRAWTKKCLENNPLPPSQRGKHPSKSLLHDEVNVFVSCREFLQKMEEYDRLMPKWNDINCEIYEEPNLLPGEKKHILITHDEYIFYTNDSTHKFWGPEEKQLLRKKGLGKGLHIRIFERTHSRCIGIWAFDNATSHTIMNGETQTMVYPDNYEVLSLRSEPKKMKAVLDERGLKNKVPIALDSIPVETIRKHTRLSYRWMDAYRKGLTSQAANYAIKKYKNHHSIPRAELIEN
ncbi:23320_t:CDS:2, partial [Gigaspora margarita]